MCLKIRCDEESGKFCKFFWELNKALFAKTRRQSSRLVFGPDQPSQLRASLLRPVGEMERAAFGRQAAVAPRRELLGAGRRAGHVVHFEAVLGAGNGALYPLLPQQHDTCGHTRTS